MGNSTRKQVADLFQFALILCAAVVILVPIYWIASGAFKQQVDVFQLKLLFTPTLACKSCLQRYCTAEGLIGAFMTGRLWLLRCDVFVRARAYVRACGCECRIISMRKEFSTLSKRDRETNSGVRWFCDGHDGLL